MNENKLVPKLRFPEFNDEWNLYKIRNVSTVITGTTPSTKVDSYFDNEGYLWVTPGDMSFSKYVYKTERGLSEKGIKKGRKLPANSVLVTCIGATIGKICMVKEICSCNQQINAVIANNNSEDFIYYILEKNAKKFKLIAGNTATPILNKKTFENLEYNFPKLKEQKKIANFLSKIDEKIDLLNQKLDQMKQFKKGLMQQIFSQKLRFDGFNDDWNEFKLKEIGEINTGNTPSTKVKEYYVNKGYLWVTPSDITNLKYVLSTEKQLSEEGAKKGRFVAKNSILVTCIASIGKNCIIQENGYFNQQINSITPKKRFNIDFVYYLICFNKEKMKKFAGITATPILNKKSFENMIFKFPSIDEQNLIGNILSIIDKKIDLIQSQLDQTEEFKKGLLQSMFV